MCAAAVCLSGQTPPPPPRPPVLPAVERIADVKRKLAQTKPVDFTAKRAVDYSRNFLAEAERAYRSNRTFEADRFAEAADAMLHVADHQEHLYAGGGPKEPPPAEAIADHLDRAYFRTQQADYFAGQSKIPQAGALAKWARDFYQLAVRAYERKDLVAADENTKCAEEVTRALENVAQANTPAKPPAPPAAPQRPERP